MEQHLFHICNGTRITELQICTAAAAVFWRSLGLSLSTVYAIADRRGGTITVESEVGKGTVLKITLRVEEQDKSVGSKIA